MQYSITGQNAKLDALFTAIGASPKLRFYDGALPANCAAAPIGTQLAEIVLPATPMAPAAAGAKSKTGVWSGAASAVGTAQYFRIYDNAGTTCHIQGTVGTSGANMNLTDVTLDIGQGITVDTFTVSEGMT